MVKMPVIAAGMRSEPPMSVPIPSGLPPIAMSADSPPEEPPEVSARFLGFTVLRQSQRSTHVFQQSDSPAISIIHSLSNHHGSRHIRLYVRHSAQIPQHAHDSALVLHGLLGPSAKADRAGLADDVKVVFQRDGEAVQRSDCLASLCKMGVQLFGARDGFVEHDDR